MNRSRVIRKTAVTLAALVAFGLVRTPVETRMTERFIAAGLIDELPLTEIRELAGQSVSFAVLGGLRPLLGIYVTLHAFDAWSYRKWETVEKDYRLITTLLPEDIDSYKTGAWHLAYNAAASALYDDPSTPEAVRERNSREWIDKGVDLLKDGIERNLRAPILRLFSRALPRSGARGLRLPDGPLPPGRVATAADPDPANQGAREEAGNPGIEPHS